MPTRDLSSRIHEAIINKCIHDKSRRRHVLGGLYPGNHNDVVDDVDVKAIHVARWQSALSIKWWSNGI